jgi:thiol-disulfide isomerase/thioredoxin
VFRPVRLPLPGTVLNLAALRLMARRRGHVQAGCAAAAALAVVLAAGCSAPQFPSGATAGMPGTTVFSAGKQPPLPPVSGHLVGGGNLSLAADRGHVVVLNFWASWCSVCHQEAPVLSAAARQFRASGVRFVGVDVADNSASATAYLRHYRISYPSLTDPGDLIAVKFNQLIPITAFPSTLVISPGGRIVGRVIGAATLRDLQRLIKAAQQTARHVTARS